MKVLHLAAGNLFGGVETYLLTLARLRHLCPDMEPHFGVCFPGRLRDELTAAGAPVHDLGAVRVSRPWTVLGARRQLKRLLRETPFDAVVAHSSWPHVVFAPVVRAAGVRLAHAVHGASDPGHWLNRWAARTPPDVVLANSRFTSEPAGKLFPAVPVEVCYLPVPDSSPPDRAAARREVRAEFGTAHAVVLQASRLEDWKGHTVLLEALGRLRDLPGWEAWVAGGPQKAGETEYLARLQATANALGIADRVRFLGQRSDVPRLLAAADVLCQPNTGPEPFGLVLVEALYAGLPVITSGFGGAAEIVTEACGALCEPGNPDAVAAALRGLLTDPGRRAVLGAAGPARAAELCDPARQLGQLAGVLVTGGRT